VLSGFLDPRQLLRHKSARLLTQARKKQTILGSVRVRPAEMGANAIYAICPDPAGEVLRDRTDLGVRIDTC
jgi:hypothetical protein